MRVIVQSMLASIPALFNVVLLCAFIFLVFGIIGVQLWSGVLRGRCAYTTPEGALVEHPDELFCALDCSQYPTTCTYSFGLGCPAFDGLFTNSTSGLLQRAKMPGSCQNVGNPSLGSIGFDNIGLASITIFTSITLEGWVDVMYALNRSWGLEPVVTAYFVLLIMFGSFFLLNLALAVIWDEYESATTQREEQQRKVIDDLTQELRAEVASLRAGPAGGLGSRDDVTAPSLQSSGATVADDAASPAHGGTKPSPPGIPSADAGTLSSRQLLSESLASVPPSRAAKPRVQFENPALTPSKESRREDGTELRELSSINRMPTQWTFTDSQRKRMGLLEYIANSPWLEMGVSVLIILNTITLAMEFHGMPSVYRTVLEVFNYVFTAVFALEMVVKMAGLGCAKYSQSAFNVFDAVVVIVSLAEIVLAFAAADLASGLSALRTFRLMRIFKLAKTWKDLQRLLVTIMRSIADVASASVVLLIIMFIFVLMGMQLFGGQFTPEVFGDDMPRAHFDNFWWAFVTVFQVLTGENWNEVLFASRKAVGDVAIVYFVALNVIGNYLILNLFLAILLGNFEKAANDEAKDDAMQATSAAGAAPGSGLPSGDEGDQPPRKSALRSSGPQVSREAQDQGTDQPAEGPPQLLDGGKDDGSPVAVVRSPPVQLVPATPTGTIATPGGVFARAGVVPQRPVVLDDSSANKPATREAAAAAAPEQTSALPRPVLGAAALDDAPAACLAEAPGADAKSAAGGGKQSAQRESGQPKHKKVALPPVIPASAPDRRGMPAITPQSDEKSVAASTAGSPDVWRFRSLDAEQPGSPSGASTPGGMRRMSSTGPEVPMQDLRRKSQILDVKMTYRGKASGTSRMTTTIVDDTGRQLAVKITKSGDVSVAQANGEGDTTPSPGAKTSTAMPNVPKPGEAVRWPKHYTMALFSPSNPVRRFCATVVTSPTFDKVILALIAISSILLAVDEPGVSECKKIPEGTTGSCAGLAAFLLYADVLLTALFTAEMLVKMVSMGVVMNQHAYLRSGWNVLDFAIVGVSVASLALGDASSLKALRSLRALRALRPLRVVSRYPSLKLVVNSIFGALPKVSNVALVNFLFFLIFAIVGVQNFTGALNMCNDPSVETKAGCIGTFNATQSLCSMLPTEGAAEACMRSPTGSPFPRQWEPPPYNFDNVLNGLLTVFETATGEMWPDIMYLCVDAVGPDQPMKQDNQPAAALFFIFIQVVCSFFMLEVFTGVIIDNFNKLKAASKGSGLLTEEQQTMVESLKMMLTVRPRKVMRAPQQGQCFHGVRSAAFAVADSSVFEICIMGMIMINTVFMAARFYGQPIEWELALDVVNLMFNVIFTVEAAIKLTGLGLRQYFSLGWNVFDFVLVLGGWIGVLFNIGPVATLLRIFRVARIFRLVRTSRGLMQLLRTLIVSIPSLLNVGALLLLLFFIFACVGMNLFSDVKHGEFLNSDANFGSFGTAMVTLFRVSTGESYNGIMHDAMVQPPYCDPEVNCGDPLMAPVFFVVFYIFSAFVLLNLLVAIILDNFEDTKEADEAKDSFKLSEDATEQYREAWAKQDPEGTGMISFDGLVELMCSLRYPLGLRNHPGVERGGGMTRVAKRVLGELDIQSVNGENFEFQIVLQALVNNASGGGWADARIIAAPRLQVQGELQIMGGLRQAVAVRRIQGVIRDKLAFARKVRELEAKLGRPATAEDRAKISTVKPERIVDKRTLMMMFAVGAASAANVPLADSTNVDKDRS